MLKHIVIGLLLSGGSIYYMLQYSPIQPVPVQYPHKVPFKGPLKINTVLQDGKQILVGSVGPESMDVDEDGNLYTGLVDGRIIKVHPSATGAIGEGLAEDIFKGPLKGVTPIDNKEGPGRPLGLRLHGNELYVVDAYFGLYSLNLKTKSVRSLVKPNDVNPPMKFPNDLDITRDGKVIYFTDSSNKWNLALLSYDVLEGKCTGRLFKVDVKTGRVNVLISDLCFSNGAQLSQDEKTLVVSETSRFRVNFYDTQSWKTKKVVMLPGMPDNIRASKRGGYWVACPIVRSWMLEFSSKNPMLRKFMAAVIPPVHLAKLAKTGMGLGVELDSMGNIVGSVQDIEGKTCHAVSEIMELEDGSLFAGSYKAPAMIKTQRP